MKDLWWATMFPEDSGTWMFCLHHYLQTIQTSELSAHREWAVGQLCALSIRGGRRCTESEKIGKRKTQLYPFTLYTLMACVVVLLQESTQPWMNGGLGIYPMIWLRKDKYQQHSMARIYLIPAFSSQEQMETAPVQRLWTRENKRKGHWKRLWEPQSPGSRGGTAWFRCLSPLWVRTPQEPGCGSPWHRQGGAGAGWGFPPGAAGVWARAGGSCATVSRAPAPALPEPVTHGGGEPRLGNLGCLTQQQVLFSKG